MELIIATRALFIKIHLSFVHQTINSVNRADDASSHAQLSIRLWLLTFWPESGAKQQTTTKIWRKIVFFMSINNKPSSCYEAKFLMQKFSNYDSSSSSLLPHHIVTLFSCAYKSSLKLRNYADCSEGERKVPKSITNYD